MYLNAGDLVEKKLKLGIIPFKDMLDTFPVCPVTTRVCKGGATLPTGQLIVSHLFGDLEPAVHSRRWRGICLL